MQIINSYILMTAIPPTLGHLDLIKFSTGIAPTTVILCAQKDEPFIKERFSALSKAVNGLKATVSVKLYLTDSSPQEPESDDDEKFWEHWSGVLHSYGYGPYSALVASEAWGTTLVKYAGGSFIPYDIEREIRSIRAREVRNNMRQNWDQILPDFRKYLLKRVTFFGAESVGKTTISRQVAKELNAVWTPEWARPYLETVGSEVTPRKMHNILLGQMSMEALVTDSAEKPLIIHDTDYHSTIGYWQMWRPGSFDVSMDHMPTADLYVILSQSDVPFTLDPLRYGVDKRESEDQYWIDYCETNRLPYVVVDGATIEDRTWNSTKAILSMLVESNISQLKYRRRGSEYGSPSTNTKDIS